MHVFQTGSVYVPFVFSEVFDYLCCGFTTTYVSAFVIDDFFNIIGSPTVILIWSLQLVIHIEVKLCSIEEMRLIHCLPVYGLSFYHFMVVFIRWLGRIVLENLFCLINFSLFLVTKVYLLWLLDFTLIT